MAKKGKPAPTDPKVIRQRQVLFGGALMLLSLLLSLALVSYLYNWKADYSTLDAFTDKFVLAKNLLNKAGALISHFFIYQGVGLASLLFPYLLGLSGFQLFFNRGNNRFASNWAWGIAHILWLSIALGYFFPSQPLYSGIVGYEINLFLTSYIGRIGILGALIFFFLCFLVVELEWTPEKMRLWWERILAQKKDTNPAEEEVPEPTVALDLQTEVQSEEAMEPPTTSLPKEEISSEEPSLKKDEIIMEVETVEEETVDDVLAKSLVEKQGFFDPTLELSKFKMPNIELLKDYGESGITINQEELEANKNKIVETLNNYNIGISNIKATIGPTVTLYEIVPDAGIRISKIKNLEDDIALSLAALGIRIIAPIPGKGTIGIEVPNQKPSIVSMRSVIASTKFQNAEMELPVALGKTISNETFVVDLAKMPHLLMAGATGQGKSV
ncbi:MAG: DNA translocase FtsK 4TM domain-containing protein, partial [Flavobacteriaceae bacterium]|nr:DNA translocase FtsK 4TM domain-containing protein [Flavobacteriaceae bacterium]